MFNRKRASSNPAPKPPPSQSASLAATKAFVRDRESNASLSSAAAAAALRTHPTTPPPVGDTVTKRMARKGSNSSQGSSGHHPALRRQNSSGSMTERSFRPASAGGARNSPVADPDAPPVPSVPKGAAGVHRRASSVEPAFRGGSPAPRGGGRGLSLDRGTSHMGQGAPGRAQRVTNLQQVPENEMDRNQPSVNFSRPMSQQQTPSPQPSRAVPAGRGGHNGWFAAPVVNPDVGFRGGVQPRPKTADGASSFDMRQARQSVQNAADRPVKKNQISQGVEGARLASGSMRAKPSGPAVQTKQHHRAQSAASAPPKAVDPKSPYAVYDPSTRTFVHKQEALDMHRQRNQEKPESVQYDASYARAQEPQQRFHQQKPAQRSPSPPPQPRQRAESPVQYEERPTYVEEGTETEDFDQMLQNYAEELEATDKTPSTNANTSRKLDATGSTTAPAPAAPPSPASPRVASNQDSPYPRLGTPVRADNRTHSLSPPRNAHFAPLAVEFSNRDRHQPLPRSVSPAKSALKASPSVSRRSPSPTPNNGRGNSRGAPSETSDTMSDVGSIKKKRNVRVSFDEAPIIAGTSAYAESETPVSPAGPVASRWSTEEQEEDFMKPRPVLPSFGSIRDKGRRGGEGARDAPEKVTETVSSSMTTSVGSLGATKEPVQASSDHALAGIIAQDFAKKKPDSNEPLPPEVTSVEGSGYVSDLSSSSDDEATLVTPQKEEPKEEGVQKDELVQSTPEPEPKTLTDPAEKKPSPPASASEPAPAPAVAPDIPFIALQPASPSPGVEKPQPKYQKQSVPGAWSDDESDREITEAEAAPAPAPATTNSTPNVQDESSSGPEQDEESSDDHSSVYSDAYEDLSEAEDGGFASIDAVVESPVVPPSGLASSKHAEQSPIEPPPKSGLRNEASARMKPQTSRTASEDWDAARQHWNDVRKQQAQRPTKATEPEEPSVPSVKPPKKKERAPTETKPQPKPSSQPSPSVQSKQSSTPAQPRKSAMKKTTMVQPPAAPEPQMRRTMRSSDGATGAQPAPQESGMRKSMRPASSGANAPQSDRQMRRSMRTSTDSATPSDLGLAASRHSMPPLEAKPPKGALQKKHIPAPTAPASKPRPKTASGPAPSKQAASVPTYDSDSDASASSFQRSRPRASRQQGNRYTMRASMRGNDPEPSMRSQPAPSMRPSSPEPANTPPASLRKSMRASSPEPSATKSSRFSIRSLSPAGRFKPSKSSTNDAPPLPRQAASPKAGATKFGGFGKDKKSKAPRSGKAKHKSRFVDSSDEDEDDRPRRFQSRFADSDDDDIDEGYQLPPGLAPVRGIPRKAGEEDAESTDLEDEASDGESGARPRTAANDKDVEKGLGSKSTDGVTNGNKKEVGFESSGLQKSKHANELPPVEAGKKAKTKRGFLGLGKKKTAAELDATAAPTATEVPDIPMPPEHRNRDTNRPLTPIGEDDDKAYEASPRSPTGKLHRRSQTPQWGRSASDSWPLSEQQNDATEQRPQSADGPPVRGASLRPTLQKRYSSQMSDSGRTDITAMTDSKGRSVSYGRSGKKKKFQGLRRVFGLND